MKNSFFKKVGRFILYILVVPFGLTAVSLIAVAGLIAFLVFFIRSIYLFFTGRSLKNDLPEDVKVEQLLRESAEDTSTKSVKDVLDSEAEAERKLEQEERESSPNPEVYGYYTPNTSDDIEINKSEGNENGID